MVDLFPIYVLNIEKARQLFFRGMAHAMEVPQDRIQFRGDADAADYDFDVDSIIDAAVEDGFTFFPEVKSNPRFSHRGVIHPRVLAQAWGYCRILRDIANGDSPLAMMIHDDASLRVPYWRLLDLGYALWELEDREFLMLQMGVDIDIFEPNAWNTLLAAPESEISAVGGEAGWYHEMMATETPLRIFRNGIRAYYDCGWLLSPKGAQVMIDNFSEARCWKFETAIGWGAHYRLKVLTESGYGIYTSRDNRVTLCKRDYNLGSITNF